MNIGRSGRYDYLVQAPKLAMYFGCLLICRIVLSVLLEGEKCVRSVGGVSVLVTTFVMTCGAQIFILIKTRSFTGDISLNCEYINFMIVVFRSFNYIWK